jgi:DNA-binding GntR family transcriptional regulator
MRRRVESSAGQSNSERVYRRLKEMILAGELAPGARLVELELAAQFGVSRTPVREALKRLIDSKLVLVDPVRAYVVRTADAGEIEEIYLVREMLDGLAARLATKRIRADEVAQLRLIVDSMRTAIKSQRIDVVVNSNIMFHDRIYRAAGNETLSRIGLELREFIRRFSREAFEKTPRVAEVLEEHEMLVDAIQRGDSEAAERLAREHLRSAREYMTRLHVRRTLGVESDDDERPTPARAKGRAQLKKMSSPV